MSQDQTIPNVSPRRRPGSTRFDQRWWIWPAIVLIPALVVLWPLLRCLTCYSPQEGDIVFQSLPHSPLVDAIEGSSRSPYSHCGMIVKKDGSWCVIEALGTVKETSLYAWVLQGRNASFDVFRVRDFPAEAARSAIASARLLLGKHYDVHYRFDNDDIYCSELIVLAYRQGANVNLGTSERLGDLHWQPYESTIVAVEKGPVPLNREMITPVSLARDSRLHCCYGTLMRSTLPAP